MKIVRKPWTQTELAELAAMHADGASRAAMEKRFGRSEHAIGRAISRLREQGVDLPNRSTNQSGLDSELEAYKRMVREGSAALLDAILSYKALNAQAVAA